jgi:hypothetical protein
VIDDKSVTQAAAVASLDMAPQVSIFFNSIVNVILAFASI